MEQCHLCKRDSIGKYANGYWFCNEHLLGMYRADDFNVIALEKAEDMRRRGIKQGSFKWLKENLQLLKDACTKQGRILKIDWKNELRNDGLLAVLKVAFVYYFLIS